MISYIGRPLPAAGVTGPTPRCLHVPRDVIRRPPLSGLSDDSDSTVMHLQRQTRRPYHGPRQTFRAIRAAQRTEVRLAALGRCVGSGTLQWYVDRTVGITELFELPFQITSSYKYFKLNLYQLKSFTF